MVKNKLRNFLKKINRIFEGEYKKISYSYVVSVALLIGLIILMSLYRNNSYKEIRDTTTLIRKVDLNLKITEKVSSLLIKLQLSANAKSFESNKKVLIDYYENSYLVIRKTLGDYILKHDINCDIKCQQLLIEKKVETISSLRFNHASSLKIESIINNLENELIELVDVANDYELWVATKIKKLDEVDRYFSFIVIILLVFEFFYVFIPSIDIFTKAILIRSDFLSRISHEIRNPMNTIIGMGDVLNQTELNQEQRQYVNNINMAGRSLLLMLDGLIDFSAINRGKIKIKNHFFNLQSLIERCIDTSSIKAHQKNVEFLVYSNKDLNFKIESDEAKIEQVIMNLLSNAVKFTQAGKVELKITIGQFIEEYLELKFEIIDTGIGISSESQKIIFDGFVQADSGIKREYGGSGLGLTISSEIIDMMGSSINVESKKGKGSNFNFKLKLKTQDYHHEPSIQQHLDNIKKAIYVCSDSLVSDFQRVVSNYSINVQGENNYINNSSDCDLVFIDDSLGIINMLEAVKFYHQKNIKIFGVLKSSFTKENIDLLNNNNVKNFIIKPLKPWKLRQYLSDDFESDVYDSTQEIDMVGLSNIKNKQIKILIVDDAPENLFLLKEFLQPVSNEITTASNGLEALNEFKKRQFDIVLMDLQMPVMDGYTAVEEMKKIEIVKGISTFKYAVTAHASEFERRKCLQAGFVDRLVKPVRQSMLIKLLTSLFDNNSISNEAIDEDVYNSDIIKKLLPRYIKTRLEDIDEMKELVKNKNFKDLAGYGHKLKGSALSYGFKNINSLGKALEEFSTEGNYKKCVECIDQIKLIINKEKEKLDGVFRG